MGPDRVQRVKSQGESWACGYLQTCLPNTAPTTHSAPYALRWWVLTEMPAVNCKMHTRFQELLHEEKCMDIFNTDNTC